jgi:hypothetical protein
MKIDMERMLISCGKHILRNKFDKCSSKKCKEKREFVMWNSEMIFFYYSG